MFCVLYIDIIYESTVMKEAKGFSFSEWVVKGVCIYIGFAGAFIIGTFFLGSTLYILMLLKIKLGGW